MAIIICLSHDYQIHHLSAALTSPTLRSTGGEMLLKTREISKLKCLTGPKTTQSESKQIKSLAFDERKGLDS